MVDFGQAPRRVFCHVLKAWFEDLLNRALRGYYRIAGPDTSECPGYDPVSGVRNGGQYVGAADRESAGAGPGKAGKWPKAGAL